MVQPLEGEERIDAARLRVIVAAIFGRCGMRPADAALLADTLVVADLTGVPSHGILRVPEYVKKLATGGVSPQGVPTVARDSGACAVVDGGNSMGQIGMQFATTQAIARARQSGIAAVAVRGSNHCGAMAYWVAQMLPHDMIGMATTNALPTMAPWGGTERLLGINPLGVAIPAGDEAPIIYDAAFSATAHGKIRVFQQRGQPLPEGWATDRDGIPTTDPTTAMDGLLTPIGEFKGTGLAMLMGLLSSMLSGAAYGTELGDMEHGATAGKDGHFVAALRIDAFEDVARFKTRIDAAVREMHACRRAPGVERIYAPGEKEYATRRAYERDGIPLNAVTLADLRHITAAYDLSETV